MKNRYVYFIQGPNLGLYFIAFALGIFVGMVLMLAIIK